MERIKADTNQNLEEIYINILKVSMEETILNPDKRPPILSGVNILIKSGRLTQELFNNIKNRFIGNGSSIDTYVESQLRKGILKWDRGRLIEDFGKITVELSPDEEDALRDLSFQTFTDPEETIRGIIHRALTNNYCKGGEND
jgi:hypothetical protein